MRRQRANSFKISVMEKHVQSCVNFLIFIPSAMEHYPNEANVKHFSRKANAFNLCNLDQFAHKSTLDHVGNDFQVDYRNGLDTTGCDLSQRV